jgi:L-threonylcarbamoyladenylate synthase
MQILKIEEIQKQDLEKKVFVYPTETVYGLGCDFWNEKLKERIFEIKKRDANKNLPVIADSVETVESFFEINEKERELMNKYWPGALTIILKIKNKEKKVAVRVSGSKIAREIAKKCDGLIVSTSANISGNKPVLSVQDAQKEFDKQEDKPDLIIDGGKFEEQKISTIVEVFGEKIEILRQGVVNIK